MVRRYIPKTDRGKDPGKLKRAASIVLTEGLPVRSVAKDYNVHHSTLNRFVNRLKKDGPIDDMANLHFKIISASVGYVKNKQIFSDTKEKELVTYIKNAAEVYLGVTPNEVKMFAFEFAVAYDLSIPESWKKNKQAGKDWFTAFIKRNPELSVGTNIITGPRKCGVVPFNRNIFEDYEFLPLLKTDCENPKNDAPPALPASDVPSTSAGHSNSNMSSSRRLESLSVGPRPLPKAPPRKDNRRRRKPKKCTIPTDTPEQCTLEEEQTMKKPKVSRKGESKKTNDVAAKGDKDEDEAWFCLVCSENYSKPGEKLIRCCRCIRWAHELCTDGGNDYVCHLCQEN